MHTNEHLTKLAQTAGLAIGWVDAFGKTQVVGEDTLINILEALGLPCKTPAQCRESLQRLESEQDNVTLPPLITGQVGAAIKLSPRSGLEGKPYRIHYEHGGSINGVFARHGNALETVHISQPGYHRLELDSLEVTLAVAPAKCFGVHDLGFTRAHKAWAASLQLYSLRREGDGGIGTYDALAEFVEKAGTAGAAATAVSPTHAMFSADAKRFSPYGPSSRVFYNAFYIDPASVLGQAGLQQAYQNLGGDIAQRCQELSGSELIDYPAAIPLRMQLLRELYKIFRQRPEAEQKAFSNFRKEGGQALQDHAIYETLHAEFHGQPGGHDWRNWPEQYRNPENDEVRQYAESHADEVSFHAFLQWQAAQGLDRAQQAALSAGMSIGLVSDMAIGADSGGSQSWSRHDQFLQGMSVGAPPDVFFQEGQSWGISALSTHGLKHRGYQAYIEMLRSAFRHAGGVRIDHVLGLIRLWLVPEGGSAKHGVYLHYPTDDLMRLISLESHRHRAIVIGEDLGTLPEGSKNLFSQAGIMGMNVLWFERDGSEFKPPQLWHETSISTTCTHDMPTVAGWWSGRDIEIREASVQEKQEGQAERKKDKQCLLEALQAELGKDSLKLNKDGFAEEAEIIDAAIRYVHSSPSPLTIIPVDDLLGIREQPNLPGTIDEQPNWRRRLPDVAEAIFAKPEVQRRIKLLNAALVEPDTENTAKASKA